MDFTKIKNFCSVKDTIREEKDTIKRIKINTHIRKMYLQITCLNKDLYPEYMKISPTSIGRKQATH